MTQSESTNKKTKLKGLGAKSQPILSLNVWSSGLDSLGDLRSIKPVCVPPLTDLLSG